MTDIMLDLPGKLPDRFLDKIQFEPNSGCWLWDASGTKNGYGQFWWDGKLQAAHRISYGICRGLIPDDLQIDHLCRVRCCVNPDHLEIVTQQDNIKRGNAGLFNAIKTHCPHGHAYSDENTYFEPRGGRRCRICMNEACRRYYRKKRASNG